jgi:outer membrane protein assembly factor BamB
VPVRAAVGMLVALTLVLASCSSASSGPNASAPAAASSSSSASGSETTRSRTDWPTYHGDAQRTGRSPSFPAPARLAVAAALKLHAAVYASPIVVNGITVVATERNTLYGLDGSGRQLWSTHLGDPARRSTDLPCGNIDPSGITGTPVYDRSTGSVFAVAEYRAPVRHELVALDLRTGSVRWRTSVDLPGTSPDAMQERGALALSANRVWIPFGGRNGDCGDYLGRVVGVPVGGGTPIAYTVPTSREAGIWTPPGPVVDSSGRLLVAVGNGESGVGDPYDYSDSILAIDPTSAKLVDSFSPTTWPTDNDADLDLGSQGPALVGSEWVFSAGKSGTGYVLRQSHFGGIGGQVSQADICRSFGGTAVEGNVVYVPCADGLRAVRIGNDGAMTVLWHADGDIAGSPVIGGGRIWSLDQKGGILHALDPGSGRSMEQVSVGETSRFATPALSGDRVLVPTLAGLVIVSTR